MNLAIVFCAAGRTEVARPYLSRVLEFNPHSGSAKRLLEHLGSDPPLCKP
jgi:hypothetical protein